MGPERATMLAIASNPDGVGPGPPGRTRRRALVADDDAQVRTLVTRLFASRGGRWWRWATARVSERPFDVAILDIFGPGRSGVEAYWEISRRHGGTRFLFSSAQYESQLLRGALHEGRSASLARPFLPGFMLEEVQNLIAEGAEPVDPEAAGKHVIHVA